MSLRAVIQSHLRSWLSMAYKTINPYTEDLVETYTEHTDAQLEAIIAKAEFNDRQ